MWFRGRYNLAHNRGVAITVLFLKPKDIATVRSGGWQGPAVVGEGAAEGRCSSFLFSGDSDLGQLGTQLGSKHPQSLLNMRAFRIREGFSACWSVGGGGRQIHLSESERGVTCGRALLMTLTLAGDISPLPGAGVPHSNSPLPVLFPQSTYHNLS